MSGVELVSDRTVPPPKRRRSVKRAAFLDAAEALILEEGYAAATSRRVAERAGLKHQLIFYYFPTLDDLLLEVLRRGAERNLAAMTDAFDEARPFQSIWTAACNPVSSRFLTEFMALANHSEPVRAEMLAFATHYRAAQVNTLSRRLAGRGEPSAISPVVMSVLSAILSQGFALEASLGLTEGHADSIASIEAFLRQIDDGLTPRS